jgi:hypothetical protein
MQGEQEELLIMIASIHLFQRRLWRAIIFMAFSMVGMPVHFPSVSFNSLRMFPIWRFKYRLITTLPFCKVSFFEEAQGQDTDDFKRSMQ